MGNVPSGAVVQWPAAFPPNGWLECNGAAVNRTTYAALFTVLGTTFGAGDGSTTFNLPDLRGEFVRGWDHGRGVDAGRELGTGQVDEIKSHDHASPLTSWGSSGPKVVTAGSFEYFSPPYRTGFTGGPETRPRNVALMYIIKV